MKLSPQLQLSIAGVLATGVLTLAFAHAVDNEAPLEKGCLHATTVDDKPVELCADGDPLHLQNDPKIQKAMATLGIPANAVRFTGCKGSPFSTRPDPASTPSAHLYLITYPIEVKDKYLAPITHELSHVTQLEITGSLEALAEFNRNSSKRTELEADFLTGIVFAHALSDINVTQFQHSLHLTGLFVEGQQDAHGTPDQRTAAFQFGVNLKFDEDVPDIRTARRYFQGDLYGILD